MGASVDMAYACTDRDIACARTDLDIECARTDPDVAMGVGVETGCPLTSTPPPQGSDVSALAPAGTGWHGILQSLCA